MRLVELRVRNYRCYKDEITVRFNDLTALVGKNDAGKSTIMEALDIFFNDSGPDKNDASKHGQLNDLAIIAVFSDLPTNIVLDQEASTTLAAEYLLNADRNLEIHKIYSGGAVSPKLTALKLVAIHPTASAMDDLFSLTNSELKKRAENLKADTSQIDKKVNAQLREAIRASVCDLALQQSDISLLEGNGANFWKGIQACLPVFALFRSDRTSTDQDPEAQDPLNAAIKEALRQQETKLNEIQQFVEAEVKKISDLTLKKLTEMDPGLARTLNPDCSVKPWASLFKVSITGDSNIPINKRGSGVRRLILLGFFRAKAELLRTQNKKQSIIYGIEEPETSQHPRNQRLLMSVLQDLSSIDQVIITTHTPMLARVLPDTSLRFINVRDDESREILDGGAEATNAAIAQSLGVLPDHNVKLFIGVEGKHDISFLRRMAKLLITGGEVVPDLEELELEGSIIFVPMGGIALALWTNRLRNFQRPEFHIYDRDTQPPAPAKHQASIDTVNAQLNCRALATQKREAENYIHFEAVNIALASTGTTFRLTAQPADFVDVPEFIRDEINRVAATGDLWGDKRTKEFLNNAALSCMTKAMLDQVDPNKEVLGWFRSIQELIEILE